MAIRLLVIPLPHDMVGMGPGWYPVEGVDPDMRCSHNCMLWLSQLQYIAGLCLIATAFTRMGLE